MTISARRRQAGDWGKVKRFLNYCVKMHCLAANPVAELKAIVPEPRMTRPLLSGRYERVIATTYEYDKCARRPRTNSEPK
jgi:hypothetical protein